MILNCSQYEGYCTECGDVHNIETKMVLIDKGALNMFDMYMDGLGLGGVRTVIFDSNTVNLPQVQNMRVDRKFVLDAETAHSELSQLEKFADEIGGAEVIVAVGGGTVMDFARFAAFEFDVPFVVIPTLLSADGYTSSTCSVIIDGQKKSVPMKAPVLVITDLDIIASAPKETLMAGVADIIAKYVSIADWHISSLFTDEEFCDKIAAVTYQALQLMVGEALRMSKGFEPDLGNMAMAHMLSGLSMQMANSSRPASGAEHLVAHLVEMKPKGFENAHGMHGECVGVGTILCVEEYYKMADVMAKSKGYTPLDRAWVEEKFGDLAEGIMIENENDVLAEVKPDIVMYHWDEVQEIVARMPNADMLRNLYKSLGMKTELSDIGVDEAMRDDVLKMAAVVRNRLTLARIANVMTFEV